MTDTITEIAKQDLIRLTDPMSAAECNELVTSAEIDERKAEAEGDYQLGRERHAVGRILRGIAAKKTEKERKSREGW